MHNIIQTIRHAARAAAVLLIALLTAQTAWAEEDIPEVSDAYGLEAAFSPRGVSKINVTADITGVGELSLNHDLTINLNGHTISGDYLNFNDAGRSLTINGGGQDGSVGNIISGYADVTAIHSDGTVTLSNVNITTNSYFAIEGPGTLNIGNNVSFNGWTEMPFITPNVKIIEGGNYNYGPDNPLANVVATVTVGGTPHYFENIDAALAYIVSHPDNDHFSLSGDTYTIHTATGWDAFCYLLANNDKGYFSGKTVKLGADIGTADAPVTRMAGSPGHDFTGTFDGDGHTLTVNISSDDITDGSTQYVAPFRFVSNTKADPSDEADSPAAFRNLHVTGNITTDKQFTGGLIGGCWGTVSIENCRVSVTIQSTISGDGTHGGIVGIQQNGALTITGCLFDGSLLGATTYAVGGFIGIRNSAAAISNSLFAPAEVTVSNVESATFSRNMVDTYNCYYTYLLNDGTNYAPTYVGGTQTPDLWYNGKAVRTVSASDDVTIDAIALTGDATNYSVSGITAYSGGGLKRGDVKYYGSDDQVSLTLSHGDKAGYAFNEYTATAGTLSGTENPYTLTMPDADVTITVGLSVLPWDGYGTEDNPYIIYNKDQLDLLAHRVNGTHGETRQEDGYSGKYFKLGNDINYPHSSDWNNFTSDENNFEAIGGNFDSYNSHFRGHFDGNNKTISGIRIYKGNNGIADDYKGIFGRTANGADIHDLTLADARITGHDDIGGIVGYNSNKSTVNRCHVAANVAICAVQPNVSSHGGIVGVNDLGIIENCISAATLTVADADKSNYYGGIVGTNRQYSTLHNNLAIGATVPAVKSNYYGAITGFNDRSTLQRNYYTACKVADVENATGVGSCNADVTDGAVPGYLLTLGEGITSTALSITIPEHKELNGSGQLVTVAAVTYNVAAAGTTVWFNSGETEGYSTSYIVDGSPVSGNSITMPAAPVTVTSNDNEHIDLWGIDGGADGSSEHPYIITTTAGWFHLAGNVAAGKSYSSKYFQLGAGISISTMVGTSDHPFSGHFNGNGNTLDIDIISVGEYTAPFRYVSGATITGLHTTGTVTTSHKCATGLVGRHDGDVTISDCRSSVSIVSIVRDDGTHGGFAATGSGTVTIEGCLFDGVICCNIAKLTNKCGGFVGWRSGTVNISNSLYAPAAVPKGKYAIKTDGNATFARNGADITNCYYTQTLGDAQGKACHSITAGENVTIDGLGAGTEYSVSGITAYPTGIKYNDVYYAGSGDQVSLTLSNTAPAAPAGYTYGYTASAGTLEGSTLTMPDEDVTISLNTAVLLSTGVAVPVSYVDNYGNTWTHNAIAIDGTESYLGNKSNQEKWYFVGLPTVAFDHTLHLYSDVHLILADGCTMNVTTSNGIDVDGSLTIYGQTDGHGTLNATGIYTNSGNITISSGRVTATGGAGIYTDSGTITISGGRVTATGGVGTDRGTITISGGRVTATGSVGTDRGTITLGCTTASDFIYASSYFVGRDGILNIANGQTLFDEDGNSYRGYRVTIPAGKTLRPGLTARQAPDGNYWTTYYNSALGFTIEGNACAYTAIYGGDKLTLHKLGKEIPAGTAVIIVADNDEVSMATTDLDDFSGTNDLRGVDVDTDVADITSDLGDGTFYVLGMTTVNNEQHFGFHRYTGSTMAAHKAFVLVDNSQDAARSLTMVFDEATGIESLTPDAAPKAQAADHWFTLDGRRLQAKPTAPGIYVNNGRKVVIK